MELLYGLTKEQMEKVYDTVRKEKFTEKYRNALEELLQQRTEHDRKLVREQFEFDEFVDGQYEHEQYERNIDFMQIGYTLEVDALAEAIKEDLDI